MNFCHVLRAAGWLVPQLLFVSASRAQVRSAVSERQPKPQQAASLLLQSPCVGAYVVGPATQTVASDSYETPAQCWLYAPDSVKVYTYVKQMPEPLVGGGPAAIGRWLQCSMAIPAEVAAGRVEGHVFLNFTVGRHGEVYGATVAKALSPACDAAALAALAHIPRLVPGHLNGEAVAVNLTLRLAFYGPHWVYAQAEVAQGPRFPPPGEATYVRRHRRVPAPKQVRRSPYVLVDFIVGADGRVREPRIQQSVSARYDQEALRLVRAMPGWVPARNPQGQAVAVRQQFVLPVPGPAIAPSLR